MSNNLPVSAAERREYTPAHYGDAADAPVYIIRPETPLIRLAIQRETLERAGSYYTPARLLRYLRDHVEAAVSSGADEARAAVDDFMAIEAPALPSEAQRAQITLLEEALADHDADFRRMIARNAYHLQIAQLVKVAHCLTGWERAADAAGQPLGPLRLQDRHGTVEQVQMLPERDRLALFLECSGLGTVGEDEAKNSAPPSGSPAAPATSTAASNQRTAGKAGKTRSPAKSGPKTRATA